MKNVRIFFRGLWRTLCGAAVAAGAGLSGYTYTLVPEGDGYMAVARFLVATAVMIASLHLMWRMGGGRRRITTIEEDR